jgi:hypothetical protein
MPFLGQPKYSITNRFSCQTILTTFLPISI